MADTTSSLNAVVIILSIGSIVCPILFGYIIWKMSQIFVTKDEFQTYKVTMEKENATYNQKLENIDNNILELLQRTAHLRGKKTDD